MKETESKRYQWKPANGVTVIEPTPPGEKPAARLARCINEREMAEGEAHKLRRALEAVYNEGNRTFKGMGSESKKEIRERGQRMLDIATKALRGEQ